ncbi:MAG TPA: thioredoxin-like domain-containing protein [Nocardioidaceae bacterium]|nr:thioredoxin-like domain-containing protein [Nocardioidaceae bacterium]
MGTRPRVRAPRLEGRGWLNTDGPLDLADLRGRAVLLDFWTFCCVNCLHVLDELRPLEEKYAQELVVIGVHSPKFVHEADPDALRAAVSRYRVEHPVLDDPELVTWQAYTARAWPTLVLIDPEGYVVAQYAGEGHVHAIDAMLAELVEEHRVKGTLQPAGSPYVPPPAIPGELAFPAKAVLLDDGRVLVADAGHDSVVEEGGPRYAGFREPNGLCVLPDGDVVVADTVGHALRALDGTLLADGLNSPWDVAWHQGTVWVAMAGDHTLWTYDPSTGEARHVGGTRNEGLLDGPLADAWFAQPSGLASDGDRLWIADAETSALRYVEDGEVHTVIGSGLFDFGFRDGPAEHALLQHPLGVAVLPDGSVAIADTYNGAVRRYDPTTKLVSTIATDLAEPSGMYVDDKHLVVVESAAHRLTRVPLGATARAEEFSHRTQRPPTEIAEGEVELTVEFVPPPGQKVDERFGPATQLFVSSTPEALLKEGAGRSTELTRRLVLDGSVGDGVLHVAAKAASCDVGGEGAACYLHQQDWGVPVRTTRRGSTRLVLPLGGAI